MTSDIRRYSPPWRVGPEPGRRRYIMRCRCLCRVLPPWQPRGRVLTEPFSYSRCQRSCQRGRWESPPDTNKESLRNFLSCGYLRLFGSILPPWPKEEGARVCAERKGARVCAERKCVRVHREEGRACMHREEGARTYASPVPTIFYFLCI